MLKSSKSHLTQLNETYFEHQQVAFTYGFKCLKAAFMAFIHGLIPGAFENGASKTVSSLAKSRK